MCVQTMRRYVKLGLLLVGMVIVSCGSGKSLASERKMNPDNKRDGLKDHSRQDRVQNEYLISSKRKLSNLEIRDIFSEFPIKEIEEVRTRPPLYRIVFSVDPELENLEKIVKYSHDLEYIEPNFIYRKNWKDK